MMAAQHRANKRTVEVIYRVYRMPEPLRAGLKARRTKFNATTAQVITNAIDEGLPQLVAQLKKLGLTGIEGKKRPARLPMSDRNLATLKQAAKQTGLDQSKLLLLSIALVCKGGK
jgi:hypothetical protein